MKVNEKRMYERVPVFIKVKTEYENINYSFSYAENISAGGMALENKVLLTRDLAIENESRLFLKFKLPNGRFYIETEALVVRITNENLIAVKFLNMEERFILDIENYIKNL